MLTFFFVILFAVFVLPFAQAFGFNFGSLIPNWVLSLFPSTDTTASRSTFVYPTPAEVAQKRRTLLDEAKAIIAADAVALTLKRRQLIYRDAYGENCEAWDQEIQRYLKRRTRLSEIAEMLVGYSDFEDVLIENLVDQVATSSQSGIGSTQPTSDPWEFERQCAEVLERTGWQTQLTAKTGDQGIDVIAQKAGVKCVLQCKLYSQPVGNSAVQEITAGRDYEQADYAAVVATAGFTKSAYALARSTNVMLLDFSELGSLDSKIAML